VSFCNGLGRKQAQGFSHDLKNTCFHYANWGLFAV
jgi:hypothetical protein